MEMAWSFSDFVMYLTSCFCISVTYCADVNASNMMSFSDNFFLNTWHDFNYFKTTFVSNINVYLGKESRRFDMSKVFNKRVVSSSKWKITAMKSQYGWPMGAYGPERANIGELKNLK